MSNFIFQEKIKKKKHPKKTNDVQENIFRFFYLFQDR